MRYIIGIDQGSTKTIAAISDENGNILAIGKTTGAEHHLTGVAYQVEKISEVCKELLEKTGINTCDIDLIFGGLAGVDWPDESVFLQNELIKLGFCNKVYITNDSIVALRGGTSRSYGAVIIAGTGSNCAVISPEGEGYVYPYVESAVQGGGALGRMVLDAIYKSSVGRLGVTKLTEKILRKLGIEDVETLIRYHYYDKRFSAEQINSMAIDLFQAAYEGDEISAGIIKWFGAELASLVNARAKLFGMTNIEFEAVVSGSIFKGPGTLLTDVVTSEIHTVCPKVKIINAYYEPVVGAVILALERLHGKWRIELDKNIEGSSNKLGLIRLSGNRNIC